MAQAITDDDRKFLKLALEEAQKGYDEGGIPIGALLVSSAGEILGRGHNLRIQKSSPTLHAEMAALENAGRQPASVYKNAIMYTTLSPCSMCTGAILLYGIPRVIIGENRTYLGSEDWLARKGVVAVNVDDDACYRLLQRFVRERPADWGEDIGEEAEAEAGAGTGTGTCN
ncbi:cytosine deaminase [Drechslerella stenobrocha 248]|uniref:Cytosine deaminase n=1 Tax=Drechslerella stenobrocha 248 TaxID=1043628 RepID=W7I7I2_9PEZI|nr:cytosine deaminase [Drechslerella stenobrocha 248]